MLCNFCSKISFRRLSECRFSFRPDADPKIVKEYATRLFYFHHCCIACVNKASIEEGCQLCSLFRMSILGSVNISRDDKLGAALMFPGAGVWVVLTQEAGIPATTTDDRRFVERTQAGNWKGHFTFHYHKIAAQIDLTTVPAGFDEVLLKCPPSVPKDTPLEEDKAWLENSMKMAKLWYQNCLEFRYHNACASSSTETVKLPARVIDVGPDQSISDSDWRVIASPTSNDALSTSNAHTWLQTAFPTPGSSEWLNQSLWGEQPGASSTSDHLLAAALSRMTLRRALAKSLKKFPHIIETDTMTGKYLTLSYCWGSTQKGELTTANYEAYKLSLPVDKLSKTIRDAITVTRALGFRYLWVDAFCIIQNSAADKQSQLPLMGTIYQDSAITLAAAVGDHADAGLFAVRNPHMWRPCPVYKEVIDGEPYQIYAQLPRNDVYDTPLDKRAWIFQEEVLARRTLKFTPKGLRWSCASFCMDEATPNIGFHPTARPHHNLREWLSQPDWKPRWVEALNPRRRYFEDWYEAVANFTQREIKFSSDRLPAMAGLAAKVTELRGYTYLQGLWKEDFEFGLLWFVTRPRSRGDGLGELIRGSEYYRVAPIPGSSAARQAARDGDRVQEWPDTSADFMSDAPESQISSNYSKNLRAVRVALGDGLLQSLPSWTWARLKDPIEFLFTIRGLEASGKPMARCLEVSAPPEEIAYLGDPSGYVVLKGALQTVNVWPGEIHDAAPSVINGRWTAQLVRVSWDSGQLTGTIIGYAALDEDPSEANIAGKSMQVLLMRDDSIDPRMENRVTPSGWLRPGSRVPLTLPIAGITPDPERWMTCLLLQEPRKWAKGIYRRVGLCQMYRGVWEEEMRDERKRQETVIII